MSSAPDDSLKQTVRGGTVAVALVQVAAQLVSLLTLVLLYRLISPEEFGLLAMVAPILMFLRIFTTMGLNIATVQRRNLAPREVTSLFWLNLLLGMATALATVMIAPWVARFFREPRLNLLTVALASTSIAVALGTQHQALLERNLRLGRLAVVRFFGQVAGSVVAVIAALSGYGVWALVMQQYGDLLVVAVAAWVAMPWRPGRPSQGASVIAHFRVGGYFSASSVVLFLGANLDKILVGRLIDAHALGLYSQAFNLMIKPVYVLTTPLNSIMLAALASAHRDKIPQASLIRAFYRLVAVSLFPAAIGLAVVSQPFMQVVGGPKWTPAGPILGALSLAILGQGFLHIAVPLCSATGRTKRLFVGLCIVTLLLVLSYTVGWRLGLAVGRPALGVAIGYALGILIGILPFSAYCLGDLGPSLIDILATIRRPAFAAIVMGAMVVAFQYTTSTFLAGSPALSLTLQIALGAGVYFVLARKELQWLTGQWQSLRG